MSHPQRPTWGTTHRLLSEFDGAAFELFVIDLPATHWGRVLDRVEQLTRLEVLFDGCDALAEPQPLDEGWRERLREMPPEQLWYGLRSSAGTARHLQINLWPSVASASLDVEFVFWIDLTFPSRVGNPELAERFEWLVELAEDCRRGAPNARCIMAPEHNGDPREILEAADSLVW